MGEHEPQESVREAELVETSAALLSREGLRDGLVRLALWGPEDLPAIESASTRPEITGITAVPAEYSQKAGLQFVTDRKVAIERGQALSLAIHDAQTGQPVGGANLSKFDWPERSAHIGYWVISAARGRGYATSAVELLKRWGVEQLGLRELVLMAEPSNTPSRRLASKAGFVETGLVRDKPSGVEQEMELVRYVFRADDGLQS